MSEEEKRAIEFLEGVCTDDCVNKEFVVKPILYLIEKQQNKIQALEKQHNYDMQMIDEVKGNAVKWANELEQEKNKINTIKHLMSIGDITDEALFTLVQTTMAELGRLEDIEEQLDKEKEKNKDLQGKLDLAKTQLDKLNKILFDKDKKISALKELLEEK